MEIDYRKPKKNELPEVLGIINNARSPYKNLPIYSKMGAQDTNLQDLVDNVHQREYRILIIDGKIVGFCAFRRRDAKITWLSQFYIDPKYQKQGYGKIFLELLEKEVSKLSEYLVLEYWPDATWAKDFYIKNGFYEDEKVYESKSQYTKVLVKRVGAETRQA